VISKKSLKISFAGSVLAHTKVKAVVVGVAMVVEEWRLVQGQGGARTRLDHLLVVQASLGAWQQLDDCT
jgi:hypothetical protein